MELDAELARWVSVQPPLDEREAKLVRDAFHYGGWTLYGPVPGISCVILR